MRLRVFLNWLVPPLTAVERKLIQAVAEQLTTEAKSLLYAQIERVDYVQRLTQGKEVNMYCMKANKRGPEQSLLFPLNQEEVKLAVVEFTSSASSKPFRATFWVVRGYVCSIEYNLTPKYVTDSNMTITKVKILIDPMVGRKGKVIEPLVDVQTLTGWVRHWANLWKLQNLRKPLPSVEREQIIHNLSVTLPGDYLELVAQTDGLKVHDCVVFGLSEIRSVTLPAKNYYLLAEIEGRGAFGVDQENEDLEIWFFDYENGEPEAMGVSFRTAIEMKLSAAGTGQSLEI